MSISYSVVIPSANSDLVHQTVGGILSQDCGTDEIEIIIVTPFVELLTDRYRITNSSASIIKVVGVDRLFPPGKMRNIGAVHACGKTLFFIDDDIVPSSNWISSLSEVLVNDGSIGAVGCKVVSMKHGFFPQCADYALFGCCQHAKLIDTNLGAGALAVNREAFREIGGFDEVLLASEDWDFCLKLQGEKWRTVFSPKTITRHNHRRESLGAILKSSYHSGYKSGLVVQERHQEQMSWLAKVSLFLSSPYLYWLLIIPYSAAISLLQFTTSLQNKKIISFLPILFMSRVNYHFGVWKSLVDSKVQS